MKKLLIIAALAASCFCLASCNHNKLDPDNPDGPERELSEENIFWGVVGQLIDYRDMTTDYKGKTFTPVIGTPDNGDESVRVVAVNDPGAAAARFNGLTGADIAEDTATKEWKNNAVGSLVWHKTTDNTSWATVDVNIPSIPSLHKIIYRSAEQGDVNGSVGNNGSAYYRFGDVITRVRDDNVREYWICVRPSFGPEDKGDSHWISVSPLPKANVWPYNDDGKPFKASNDMNYGLPTKIRNEVEWHQDLAEMLFAIMYPGIWSTNVTNYYTENVFGKPNGLRMFNDFDIDNIKYHNAEFWKNVQQQWKDKNLVRLIFGISYEEMENAINPNSATARGLHLLYNGYEWSTSVSNKPKLFQVHYSNGSKFEEKNMHLQTKSTISSQVVTSKNKTESNTNYSLDVYTRLTEAQPYLVERRFFSDENPRWIVRYATGEELSDTKRYDPQQPIPGFNVASEVYRYYKDVFPEKNLTDAPEVTDKYTSIQNDKTKQDLTSAFIGNGHYSFGDVLRDANGNRWFVVRPAGGSLQDNHYTDQSPFAELVSFDGITFSADGKVATNVPDKDRIIRVAMPLWFLCQEAYKHPNGYVELPAQNIRTRANVQLLHLMNELYTQRYNGTTPSIAEVCSFAFNVQGSDKQHLLRYILQTKDPGNEFVTVIYDHYPTVSTQTNVYPGITAAQFSNTPIYLQDVADAQKVSQYGPDYMASVPFSSSINVAREYRKAADARAEKASNYVYNINTWDTAATKPLGMWNEPVLFLRATALYDRGTVYATQTVDGVELSLDSKAGVGEEWAEYSPYTWFQQGQVYDVAEYRLVSGVNAALPTWQSVWAK